MVSNTFSTPQASAAINLARISYNQSLLATATTFYGPSLPTSSDITILGTATAPSNGWMYRDSKNGVLYIKDSANNKGLAGDFTVNGIGSRIIESLSDYYGQESNFDLGELFKTVGSNSRLYIKKSNTTGDASIADLGIPPESYSITRPMLGNGIVDGTAVSANISVHERNEVISGQKNFIGNTVIVSNTSASASVGPILELYRNSTSAVNNDLLGRLLYKGNNGSGNNTEYAAITTKIIDNTNGSEDSSLILSIMKAGSLTDIVEINQTNSLINFDLVSSQSISADVDLVSSNSLITGNTYTANANVSNDMDIVGNVVIGGSISAGSGLSTVTSFTSSNITVTSSSQVYEATHSIGKIPEIYFARLVCTIPELGYLQGEEINFPPASVQSFGGGSQTVGQVGANTTHLFMVQGGNINIGNKATPASSPSTITYANWALKFYAVGIN